jgi:predicted acylesterase/phospholipase RssA
MLQKKVRQHTLVMNGGGGAFGTYEAGQYRFLYAKISENLKSQIRVSENVFDIIAGTPIGVINDVIILGHALENKKENLSEINYNILGKLCR